MGILSLALALCLAAPAFAATPYLAVRDWPVSQFFAEVGAVTQAEMLEPLSKTFDVQSSELHACLMVVNSDPNDRNMVLHQAVDECLAELKGWNK